MRISAVRCAAVGLQWCSPGWYLYLKQMGMLFVWLRGVNFGCLVSLRMFLGNTNIRSRQSLV